MDDIVVLEAEIVELDDDIEEKVRAISDKLAAPHTPEDPDLEEEMARLSTLVNLRFTKVAILSLISSAPAR